MGILSNIISAAVNVNDAEGGYVRSADGPHYTVRVIDSHGDKHDVVVSVVGSGGLMPSDHTSNREVEEDLW